MGSKEIISILLPSNEETLFENARKLGSNRYVDSLLFTGGDAYDNKILLFLVRRKNSIQTYVYLCLGAGQIYSGMEDNFSDSCTWHSKCVKVECSEPMRNWRISYNGLLKKYENTEDSHNHVKLNFLWHPISSTVYYDKSGQPSFEYHKNMQLNDESVYSFLQGYEQWGMLHGIVQINEQQIELNLTALKKRSWALYKKDSLTLTTFAGNGMQMTINSIINSSIGHVRTLRKHFCISDCDFQYPFKIGSNLSFQLSDGRYWYRVQTEVILGSAINYDNLQIFNVTSNVDGVGGEGLLLFFRRCKKMEVEKKDYNMLPVLSHSNEIFVNLRSIECQDCTLVGEKAASLSKMDFWLKHYFKDEECAKNVNIPKGMCLTINAMDLCVRQNEDLKCSMNLLKYGLHEIPNSQMALLCEKLQKQWILARMDTKIINFIENNTDDEKSYAIRASGIFEDTVDTSAAGQSSTYLQIKGVTDIINAIKKCWASEYSFMAVQYRRDHGLPLYVKLGVIVQEMVIYDVNGVLFTSHPITNDPRLVSITYSFKEHATIDKAPSTTILVDKRNYTLTETIYSSQDDNYKYTSLPSQYIPILCKISNELEELFSYPVDVEWAITDNIIHLLQCRPITTMFTWSDFEIKHELDSGFTDYDAITFHNCGEIVSDATSPLSITFNNRIMEEAFPLVSKNPSTIYHKKLLVVSQFHIAMNICNGLLLQVGREIPFFQKIIDIIVCGQVITNETLYMLAQKRNGITNSYSSFLRLLTSIKLIVSKDNFTTKAINIANQFRINADEYSSAEVLLQHITHQAAVLKEVAEYHLKVSSACNILKAGVLCMMCKDDEDNLPNHLANLSWYLSSCDELVSADVPKALQEIARILQQHADKEAYLSVPTSYKCDWMQKHCPEAWIKTKIFFEKHGSRCVKEADLMTQTWSMQSDPIFECIDALIKSDKLEVSPSLTEYNRQENLASGSRYDRRIRWMLASCRNAVINREKTKQCLVIVLHQFRLAFQRLGELLSEDVVICNEESIFFYTFHELHQLIKGRDRQSILHKGQRRYRLWNQLNDLKFDDVIFGIPRPIERESVPPSDEIFRLQGTSVSHHSAIGRACVLSSITGAREIQSGDVLVTRCVDIGWSPYFPLLSGLITELGGLMSHGAIIARECGLPCVIGVENVTSHLKTGDKVEINGPNGVITRIQGNDIWS